MNNESNTVANTPWRETSLHGSFATSVILHGTIIICIFKLTHWFQSKEPFRLPPTITLVSLPLPEKSTPPLPSTPSAIHRVQVGRAIKSKPAPVSIQPTETAPAALPAAPQTSPVAVANASENKAIPAIAMGQTVGSSGGGEVGAAVRIGSVGNLDNVEYSPLYNPKPAYPLIALKADIQGSVDVDLVINEFGQVENFSIVNVHGHPSFGDETAKVIGKWRFPPPRIDGKKVKIKFLYTVIFKLD